ncbi:Clathrin heavy chain 1 [Grifola frondosa]|uniref:Clathrin heavy chain 1 n=1 Tax=Grifola frondosa TaxID=5627 RepID=A0A1C7LPT6_GRIFR|nr:Clathrin heavy chain 1 [Grifola frondosa]
MLHNTELAFKLASRANPPSADDLYIKQYQQLFQSGQFGKAVKVAVNSPRGILHTAQVIQAFKQAPAPPGELSPFLHYFGILLEKGELNYLESVELARLVLQLGRKQLLEKWLKENKLTCSEELGDIVRLHDMTLALSVYFRENVPNKGIACFAETGQTDKVVLYAKKVGYTPDFVSILQHIMHTNPEKGTEFAAQLANDEAGPLVDIETVVNIFMSQNMVQSVAYAMLGNEMFTHYDRPHIANLYEKAGVMPRALKYYEDLPEIKRVIVHTAVFQPDLLVNYFSRLMTGRSFVSLEVVGGLPDVDCDETTIKALLASVPGNFPIDELVHEVEARNRLKLILPWLEASMQAGSQGSAVFNALANIYTDSNNVNRRDCSPEGADPNVSIAVKTLLSADLPIGLIELLEKIILGPSLSSDNWNLLNLIMLTAVRVDKGKVVGYIGKLQNHDTAEIAKIAIKHYLYVEAFMIYKKYEQHAMAINVLVEHVVSVDRGVEYANKVNKPEVWSGLAERQLDGLRIKAAVDSYIQVENLSNFLESLRKPKIDTELAYAYAKWIVLHDMEDFLSMTNVADVLEVVEKCFEDQLYHAAKLSFTSISNWAHLATALIYLGENQGAVESARKGGNTQ